MPMRIDPDLCQRCGACMMICPVRAVVEQAERAEGPAYRVDPERCDDCRGEVAPLCRGDCPVPDCLVPVGPGPT